jgi:anti-anti-sigma regulatory factor
MLQVRRSVHKGGAILALSGWIDAEQVLELKSLLEVEAAAVPEGIVLDLADVRLVSREAVRFLAACEADGIQLSNCSPYVREWIEKGKGNSHES